MITAFTLKPLRHELVHQALLSLGLTRVLDEPLTLSKKTSEWSRDSLRVTLESDLSTGISALALSGDDSETTLASLQNIARWKSAAQLMDDVESSPEPGQRFLEASMLLTFGRFCTVDSSIDKLRVEQRLRALAKSTQDPVRHEAMRTTMGLLWPSMTDLVQEVAQRDASLSWTWLYWQAQQQANTEKLAKEKSDKEFLERLDALPTLIQQGQFQEAKRSATELLASCEEDERPTIYRALALSSQGLNEIAEALLYAAAWRSSASREERAEPESLLRSLGAFLRETLTLSAEQVVDIKDQSDAEELGEGLELALQEAPAPQPWLRLAAALLLQEAASRSDDRDVELFNPLMESSTSARVWMAYGLALHSASRAKESEAAYRRALHLLQDGAQSEQDAFSAIFEGTRAPTVEVVYERLRSLYREDYPELYRIVQAQLALPGQDLKTQALLYRTLGLACTFTNKHDEAIAAYQKAITLYQESNQKPDELIYFNLACELAKRGDHDEALTSLSLAASLNDTVAKRASSDDYFSSLWNDPRFFVASVSFEDPPTKESAEKTILRAMGRFYRGENEQALQEGRRAVASAALLHDDVLLSKALMTHGNLLTYLLTPARGASLLERSVALADATPTVSPGDRAEAHHMLGAAYHAAQRFDEAEAAYQRALSQRVAAFGEEAAILAKSYGDLARLALNREKLTDAEAHSLRAINLLKEILPKTEDPDAQLEILSDLALLNANHTALIDEAKRAPEDVLTLAEETVYWLSQLEARDASIPGGLIARLRRVLSPFAKAKLEAPLMKRLGQIAVRLSELEEPNAAIREEKRYWLSLELGAQDLREKGVSDIEIARAMSKAMRGEDPGGLVAEHPAFQGLSVQFAQRLNRTTDLVMVAMSLDLAISGATSVLDAIRSLQEFAVANISEESNDDEEEDDEAYEDEDQDEAYEESDDFDDDL